MDKRYSPTSVRRFTRDPKSGEWTLVDNFEDATVRNQGTSNYFSAPEAMLRAYKNDISFLNTLYPEDYHFDKQSGYLVDCDSDIALRRVLGFVLNQYSFGHGDEQWIVMVADGDDGWAGNTYHVEMWRVSLREQEASDVEN